MSPDPKVARPTFLPVRRTPLVQIDEMTRPRTLEELEAAELEEWRLSWSILHRRVGLFGITV
jgi:hypothetical protein